MRPLDGVELVYLTMIGLAVVGIVVVWYSRRHQLAR